MNSNDISRIDNPPDNQWPPPTSWNDFLAGIQRLIELVCIEVDCEAPTVYLQLYMSQLVHPEGVQASILKMSCRRLMASRREYDLTLNNLIDKRFIVRTRGTNNTELLAIAPASYWEGK